MIRSLIRNLKAVYGRVYVRIVGGNRYLHEIFADAFLPLLNLSAYVFVYKAMNAPQDLASFVIIGGVMVTFWLNVLWSMGAQLYWEKEMGNLEVFLLAPISRMAILFGMAIGGMINTSLRALATLILGLYIFNVNFNITNPILVFIIFILTLIALYALGMLFSSLFLLFGREAWHSANLLQEPIYFLSGIYFPIKYFPFWLQVIASLIPLTIGLDAMRKLIIYGYDFIDIHLHFFLLISLSIILLILAKFSLNYMEKIAKKEGRLTLKWI